MVLRLGDLVKGGSNLVDKFVDGHGTGVKGAEKSVWDGEAAGVVFFAVEFGPDREGRASAVGYPPMSELRA